MELNFATIKMHHATRAKAEKLATALRAEYPALTLKAFTEETDHPDFESALKGWIVNHTDAEGEVHAIWYGAKVPELAELLDICQEEGYDPEEGAEEEEEETLSGSVVKEAYRAKYKEVSSNGQTCGDWLAERMVDDTSNGDGKLMVDALIELFEVNGLDMGAKWALARNTQTRGWQGRFRMSGRIVLEKAVTLTGVYSDPDGVQINPPAEWLEEMRAKHAVWLKKEAKRQENAEKAVRSSVEG